MGAEETQLLAGARIGIDAESFARSDFGKFLMAKAEDEIAAATNDLIDADPEDAKANRELRNQIHVARMFLTWLGEAINVGRQCHDQLKEIEDLSNH